MVGGPTEYFERSVEVLNAAGKNIVHLSETVGAGHIVKSVNNLLYGCNIMLAMKATQAFENLGIDPVKALETIQTSSGGSNSINLIKEYVGNNRQANYDFKISLLIKDIDIGIE